MQQTRLLALQQLRQGVIAVGQKSWLLFLALSVVNGSNYLFHVVVSRALGPSDYGALGAVLAVLMVLAVPLGAIQTTIAKRQAELSHADAGHGSHAWTSLLRGLMPWGIGATALLLALSPLMTRFLRLDSYITGVLMAIYVLPAALGALLRGVLQGSFRFKALAVASVVPVIVRFGVGIAFVRAGGGVPGAVAATVVADGLGVMLMAWLVRVRGGDRVVRQSNAWFFREFGPVALGLGTLWLFIELDLLLARHTLPSQEAGAYAAAGLLARAVLFIPGAIGLIAFPHFAEHHGRGREAYGWLLSSAAVVLGLGALAWAVLTFGAALVVGATFGNQFATAAELLPILALAMVALGVVNIFVFFHLSAGARGFQLLWPVMAVEVALVALAPTSGTSIALVVLVAAWAVAFVGFLSCRAVALSPVPLTRLPTDLLVHSSPLMGAPDLPDLSVVMPSHNGGVGLLASVRSVLATLEELGQKYEVIVVSDGSTDGCDRLAASAMGPVGVVHYGRRQGKGVALRVGMTRARGKYVAFIDSDGELDVTELRSFLSLMDLYDPDLVVGSKRHPLSRVDYPTSRRFMSWLYQRLVRVLFGLNVRDTQTGMKLIRRDVLDAVLPRMLEKRFAFDLEFLVVAKRVGYRRFFEAPVKLDYQFSSTVDPQAVVRILTDTAAIFYRRFILRSYDRQPEEIGLPQWEETVVSTPLAPALEHGPG